MHFIYSIAPNNVVYKSVKFYILSNSRCFYVQILTMDIDITSQLHILYIRYNANNDLKRVILLKTVNVIQSYIQPSTPLSHFFVFCSKCWQKAISGWVLEVIAVQTPPANAFLWASSVYTVAQWAQCLLSGTCSCPLESLLFVCLSVCLLKAEWPGTRRCLELELEFGITYDEHL